MLRLFKCNNAYLGVCVPTDSMIQKLKNYSFSNTAVTIAPTGTFTDKNSMLDFFSYGIFKLQLIHPPEIFQYFYLLIFHCRIILLLSYVGLRPFLTMFAISNSNSKYIFTKKYIKPNPYIYRTYG